MSFTPEEILSLAGSFQEYIDSTLVKNAKDKKKLDPKAKVRSRGKVVFPAESPKVKDKKDHFPINDADQARNALARVGQYDKVPSWYKGSLTELKEAVQKAVHKHYKSIGVGGKKANSYSDQIVRTADEVARRLLDQDVSFEEEADRMIEPELDGMPVPAYEQELYPQTDIDVPVTSLRELDSMPLDKKNQTQEEPEDYGRFKGYIPDLM